MQINELIQIHKIIKEMESQIDKNAKEFMGELYRAFNYLKEEVEEGTINLGEFNNMQFSLKFLQYEIIVTYMDAFAVPINDFFQLEGEQPTYERISLTNKLKQTFSGCITIYFCDNSFDYENFIYLDRIFINKDYDIAFQGYDKYAALDSKETIIPNLKQILTNMLSQLFRNFQHLYPQASDVMQTCRGELKTRRYNIGFRS